MKPPTVPRILEADLQRTIIDAATAYGWTIYHTHDARRSNPGWPDLVLCRPPQLLIVELKREDAAPTPAQRRWLQDLTACGIETHIWRPSDIDDAIQRLARRHQPLPPCPAA